MKLLLKEIVNVQMGYSFRSRLEPSENGNIGVIQMKDLLDDNIVNCNDLLMIEMKNVKKSHFVKKGDLIFRSRGLVSTSAIILDEPNSTILSAPLIRIRITDKKKVYPEYLNWFISQNNSQKYFTSRAKGTAQKMITKEVIEELEIYLPSLEKQIKIVELANLVFREKKIIREFINKKELYISKLLMNFAKGE